MSVLQKFHTEYAHGFFLPDGKNKIFFPGLPTHREKEIAEGCPSVDMVKLFYGLDSAGPVGVKVSEEGVLSLGLSVQTPLGEGIIYEGPLFDEAKARAEAEGRPIPSIDSEADVLDVIAREALRDAAEAEIKAALQEKPLRLN